MGEKLDEVGREIKGGSNRAGSAAKDQFGKAKQSVQNMGVESRVYGRLHWDKALNDAAIDLTASADGVVTLSGTVADARAKVRAVELTRETVGGDQGRRHAGDPPRGDHDHDRTLIGRRKKGADDAPGYLRGGIGLGLLQSPE